MGTLDRLPQRDRRYEKRSTLLHHVWNYNAGCAVISTRITSQLITQYNPDGSPYDFTRVEVDSGYCLYIIKFLADGSVESSVFA